MVSPEDIAVIPGAEWAIISGAREGGRLQLVNVNDKTSTVLFPTPDSEQRLDAEAYPECPGPFDLANPDVSRLHGLYLEPGEGSVHTLLVVHHGPREAIEFFEVDAGAEPPSLAWVGCAVAPEGASLNSVVALPGGGFATTNAGIGSGSGRPTAAGRCCRRVRTPRRTASRCRRTGRSCTSPAGPRRS